MVVKEVKGRKVPQLHMGEWKGGGVRKLRVYRYGIFFFFKQKTAYEIGTGD